MTHPLKAKTRKRHRVILPTLDLKEAPTLDADELFGYIDKVTDPDAEDGDMHTTALRILPDVASAILDHRNPHNRNITPGEMRKLQADFDTNGWILSMPHGLAFDYREQLADGQHRLTLLSRNADALPSGVPFLVSFNLPQRACLRLDQNKQRRTQDALTMALKQEGKLGELGLEQVDKRTAAVMHLLWGEAVGLPLTQKRHAYVSRVAKEQWKRFFDAFPFSWAFAAHLPRAPRGIECSTVRAAFTKAHIAGVEEDLLSNLYAGLCEGTGVWASTKGLRRFRDRLLQRHHIDLPQEHRHHIPLASCLFFIEDVIAREWADCRHLNRITFPTESAFPLDLDPREL